MAIYWIFVASCCLLLARASMINDMQELNFEPKIAIQCGKVAKHIDVETGKWIDDEDRNKFCSSDNKDILKYCQKTYPNITITNIIEANENVTLCDGIDCQSQHTVIPRRCLVGKFEADALTLFPPNAVKCVFGYIHEGQTCNTHDYWRNRAEDICKEKGKKLEKYGILVPCDIDMLQGVEYVCCQKAKTLAEIFEDKLIQFAKHIPAASIGCHRSNYKSKVRSVEDEKNKKISEQTKNMNEAKNRKAALQQDDPEQAKSMYNTALNMFRSTIKSIVKQALLNEARIDQEDRECLQININHKKHLAMKSYLDAVRSHADNPNKILKTFKRLMRSLENDQSHNILFAQSRFHSKSESANNIREAFVSHLHRIKSTLKEAVEILKHVKSVEGKIPFYLPSWAGKIDFEWAHKPVVRTNTINPTDQPTTVTTGNPDGLEPDGLSDIPPENEHEDYGDHPLKSRAVFAAVIGLSCGALVIMIIIVLALFFRKGSSKRPTKTVIAEDDTQEKRHLLKMQEDGFENPTYKFFVH